MLQTLRCRLRPLPLLLWLLALVAAAPAYASHLLGGEMTYRYLDNTGPATAPLRYEITITIYNNCGNLAIRPSAAVGIYDQATGTRLNLTTTNYLYTTTYLSGQTGMMSIPQTSISACTSPPIPAGCTISGVSQPYQLQKFVAVVNLPNTTTGYYALFTDGTRNYDITNMYLPDSQSLTLYSALMPPTLPNRSPVFADVAVAFLCANDTTFLLNNAVDPDGDRLVYSFGQPYGTNGGNGVLPTPTFLPPPPVLSYVTGAGYTAATPLGTTAGNYATINASTGIAKYRASTAGRKYAVAVDVKEYRTVNGVERLIGTTRRDLQLVVANCPTVAAPLLATVAVMPRNYTIEAGSTLSIPITATQSDGHPLALTLNSELLDGGGIHDAALDGNTGTVNGPTGTATISGASGTVTGNFVYRSSCTEARATPYDIALVVKDNGCAGKTVVDILHITVVKPSGPTAIAGELAVCGQLPTTRSYTASGGTAPGVSWRVVGGTIVGSRTANPVQISWTTAGTATLVARGLSRYGCLTDSITRTVTVTSSLPLTVTGNLSICQGASTTLTAAGSTSYTVTGGATTLTGAGPFVVTPTQTTTYTITGTAVTGGCTPNTQVTVTVNPLPTATPGAAVTFCSGGSGRLGAAAVAGYTYSWSPSTGLSSSTAANPTVTLTNTTSAATTQTYTLTTTNTATGCAGTGTVVVTVNPAVVANAGQALTLCSGTAGQLGAAAVAGYTYSWSPSTGLSSSTAANPTVTLTTSAATTQTYTLTTTGPGGCTGTATVAVTVNPAPTAVAGAALTICSGGSGQLGAAPVAGYTYSWSPSTGLSSSTAANPTVTLTNTTSAATTQTYTLTTTGPGGCTGTGTVTVTVSPAAVANAGAAVTFCSGGSGQLGAAAVAGYTYSWSPSTGLSSSTAANPTVTLTNTTSAATTQTYTLTTTGPGGCTATATVAVTVNPAVVAGTVGTSQTVCPGSAPAPFTSTAGASGGVGTYDYQWESSPDNATWTPIAGATSATYAPGAVSAPTYYRRRVTAGSCATVYSNVVAIQLQPVLATSVQLATPPVQCAGSTFTFTPVPTNGGTAPTYRWFVNGSQVATTATYSSSTLANGDQVRVEMTPTAGFCASGPATATVSVSLLVAPTPTITIKAQTVLPVCEGSPVTFAIDQTTNLGASTQYQWQVNKVDVPGAQGTTFTSSTLRTGQQVSLVMRTTTACGTVTVTSNAVPVTIIPGVHVSAGPDKTIMEGERVTLEGQANGSYSLVWLPAAGLTFVAGDSLHPVASPAITTTYTLTAKAGSCTDQSSVTVTVTPSLRIPNAFSPNGDGDDDTWEIDHIGDYPSNRVVVYNRWGSKVFESTGYTHGNEWNGHIGGQPAPIGTYYYVITLGNGKSYNGPITIVY